jgi:short-subunit dehydrogenase
MEDLKGKVVMITGAARGIGRCDAFNFAREGSRVVITDVDEGELSKTAGELRDNGYEAHPYVLDVADRDACFELTGKVEREVGPIDVLINNAGIVECRDFLDVSEYSIRRTTEVNYLGQVWMMSAVLPGMVKRGSGHVVNMASMGGKVASAKMGPYCASKHAVIGLTDSIRQELRGSGVYFTLVEPGFVDTGMVQGIKVPFITRWIGPEKVSDAILKAVKRNRREIGVPAFLVRFSAFMRGLCLPGMVDFLMRILGAEKAFEPWVKDQSRPF